MADQNNNQLQVILKEQHVPKAQADALIEAFGGPFNEVGEILADYQTIKVTDVNDTATMTKARVKRLALKKARTTVEGKRKELKENIVKQGRAIDSVARFVKEVIAPAEEYLQLQEDYAKLEAKRVAEAKRADRIARLSKYPVDPDFYNLDAITDEAFDDIIAKLEADRLAAIEHQKNVEAQQKAEADARAAAQKRRERDNARLRAVSALGFYLNDVGQLLRQGGYDTGHEFDSLLELDDKAFDAKVDEFIKASDKQFADEAEARRAEQAKIEEAAKRQTARLNEITGYGARYDAEHDRYVLGEIWVTINQVETKSDEDWATIVALFSKTAAEIDQAERERKEAEAAKDAELKAARDKKAREDEAKAKAEADERVALLAPDKTKLTTLADGLEMVRSSKLPALKTKQAQDIVNEIDADLTRLIANIRAKADRLK